MAVYREGRDHADLFAPSRGDDDFRAARQVSGAHFHPHASFGAAARGSVSVTLRASSAAACPAPPRRDANKAAARSRRMRYQAVTEAAFSTDVPCGAVVMVLLPFIGLPTCGTPPTGTTVMSSLPFAAMA